MLNIATHIKYYPAGERVPVKHGPCQFGSEIFNVSVYVVTDKEDHSIIINPSIFGQLNIKIEMEKI